jgi:anti-sigma factor RsiW
LTIDRDTLLLLNAYHDGELSPGEALAMERRMEREPELVSALENLASLSSELKDILPGDPAPERLRGMVLASIADDFATDETADEPRSGAISSPRRSANWQSIAASLVIGLAAGGLGGGYAVYIAQTETQVDIAQNEIVGSHLRGLIAPQPFDVASSSGHVVKPWFNGKTTIAPTTPDLAAQGFPLIGGRVDVIAGTPVPVMIYQRRQHIISVTVTAAKTGDTDARSAIDGTNVLRWTHGDLAYWAVSDLNQTELASFADLYRKQLAPAL